MSSLGNDLSRIRKEQDLALEEIKEKTKIPLRVLQSIEDDSIFTDFNENKTYIRSFVRSYGKAIGIDDRVLKIALDQTEVEQYQDLLQKVDPFDPGEITDEPPFNVPEPKGKRKKRPPGDDQQKTSWDRSAESRTRRDPNKIRDLSQQEPKTENSINWADIGQRFRDIDNGSRVWIGIIIFLLLMGIIGYFFIYRTGNRQPIQPAADSLASIEQDISDSNSLQLQMDDANEAGTASAELPDTLQLVIYAANDKLEPVRVKSDLFTERHPYWLEQGEAMRFNFVDSIQVRGQYSRMVLLLNGHPVQDFVPEFYRNETRQLHIPRSYFERDPKWKTPSPDSFNLNIPPPDTIKDRPVFNQE